jgi:hypothetical protein
MSAMLTAEAIIFAIHSAIKLGGAFQKAYANSLKGKSIVLPLPKVGTEPSIRAAMGFFEENKVLFLEKIERLAQLHKRARTLEGDEKEEYFNYYDLCFNTVNAVAKDNTRLNPVNPESLMSLLRIRQWEEGKVPITRPLQLVAGTLVEVGIDYFSQVPGAIRSDSGYGIFLKSFLNGIDDIPFAEAESVNRIVKKVVPKLFVSAAETMDQISSEITGDEKLQKFIQATSQGITKDLYDRIEVMSTADDDGEVIRWGQMLFRSLVKNSGTYVFNAPGQVVDVGTSQEKLIQAVGTTLMSAILDPNPSGLELKNVFTVETLDSVVKSSLEVVAQYPSLISDKKGIKEIVSGVAESVAKSGINRPGLVPELARLVLLNTAGNLNTLWDVGDANAKHLLVTTIEQFLFAISTKPDSGKWRPQLTNSQLLGIAEYTFNEVVSNPSWINEKVNEESMLAEVLNATFDALGAIPEGQRLNFNALQSIIQINLRTVATSKLVLKKVKWGNNLEETTILNKSMDLVLGFVFKGQAQQVGNKTAQLFDLMEYVMDVIVSQHPNSKGLMLTQLFLNANTGIILESGINENYADELLNETLEIISAHPDLLVNDDALQNIIKGVASSFQQSGIRQSGLLSEFIRITLINVSGNLDLILTDSTGEKKHILVVALQQVLNTFTSPSASGKWKPQFSGTEVLAISEGILDEVAKNPNWINDKVNEDSLLLEVLNTTFKALENIPQGSRINYDTFNEIIEINLRTVANNKLVLVLDNENQKSILNKSLDLIFNTVFNQPASVDKSELLIETLDYAFESIILNNPDNNGLIVLASFLQKELGIISSTGINKGLADQFVSSALAALSEHPELISKKIGIQNIVVGVTSTLAQNGIKQPGIVTEFIRLILDHTAGNLNLIIDTSKRTEKNILVLALQQVLKATSKRPSGGKWKPKLTPLQILEVTENILGVVVANPLWVKNNFIQIVVSAVYQSLESIPSGKPLGYTTLKFLIQEALLAVNARKQLAVKVFTADGGVQKLALTYSLDGLFVALYDESGGTVGSWTLTQTATINSIIEHYLLFFSEVPVTKESVDKSVGKIKKAVSDLNNDLQFNLQDFLNSLTTD